MPKLYRRTKRLVIRPMVETDFEAWKAANSTMLDPLTPWDRQNQPKQNLTKAKFKELLVFQRRLRERDKFFDLAVFERSSGDYIGNVAVMEIIRGVTQSAFLGYSIFNRYWGHGYGKESVVAALDVGFRDLELHRLEAGIEPKNRRSTALVKSLNFRKEGLKRAAVLLRGEWQDLLVYALTSEEFGVKWRGRVQSRPR